MGCTQLQAGQEMLNPLFFPGLTQWWCAERVTGANNDAIDLSGNARTGTNVGGNAAVVPAVVNGRPVWRFNGVNSFFTFPTTGLFGPSFSAWCLFKTSTVLTAATMIGWVNAAATRQVVTANAAANIAVYDGVNHPTSNIIDDFTNFSLLGVNSTAGNCVFYQNGVNIGAPAAANGVLNLDHFGGTGVFFGVMDMAECVLYSGGTSMNATQIAQLTEYFRERYNF